MNFSETDIFWDLCCGVSPSEVLKLKYQNKEAKMNAIEIHDLTKSFRGMYALNGLSMTVPQGAIYGFIGENGSGKSTTEK